jgi:hypothetical protein
VFEAGLIQIHGAIRYKTSVQNCSDFVARIGMRSVVAFLFSDRETNIKTMANLLF